MRPHYPVFFIFKSDIYERWTDILSVRAASHCRAPALTKILLVFVFLGVYAVGFFGKTFLKHDTWGLQMGGSDLAAPSKQQRERDFSLGSDPLWPCPREPALPIWDPRLAKKQDVAVNPGACPASACLHLEKGQVQRPLGVEQTLSGIPLLVLDWTRPVLSQKSLLLFFSPKLELPLLLWASR